MAACLGLCVMGLQGRRLVYMLFFRFGGTFHFAVPGRSNFKLVDGKCIEHVLKTNFDNYVKTLNPFDKVVMHELNGKNGMFMADGAEWRGARKVLSHLFSTAVLKNHMEAVFLEKADLVVCLMLCL